MRGRGPWRAVWPAAAFVAMLVSAPVEATESALSAEEASRFAQLALECVHREYPNKIAHVLSGPDDVQSPRQLTPAFYGCYDWHSSVHGHWLLLRLARWFPEAAFAEEALQKLATSLTAENIAREVEYVSGAGRVSFERPYGLAWLLQLVAEAREWNSPTASTWAANLAPLEELAAARFAAWLPKLDYAIRTGEHSQTAFAFGLALDWSRVAEATEFEALLKERTLALYGADQRCPVGYEPSGQDFLSPCLAEADLMRRILAPGLFADWLGTFLPSLGGADHTETWMEPAEVSDRADPKLAHLDGLNLSRAWMLRGIAAGLPIDDVRRENLLGLAHQHAQAALPAVTGEHYEGGHWLGSFATYLVTDRGLPQGAED